MKSFGIKLLSFLMLILTVSIFSCKDEDPIVDPCTLVTCPTGFTCVEGVCEPDDATVETVSGEITTNTTWTNDKVWKIVNKVIVQSGTTLTIEPGTIIKGEEGEQSLASALIIANGGKLNAEGTAAAPIIFTSILDNIEIGQTSGTNLTKSDKGLWGGLIVLGSAPSSVSGTDTEGQIEGVPADIPNTTYGGNNPTDNSGVMKYISIRHGGIRVSDGNEINGLTLGGVGSGTVIENIEVISNLDDGIEWFGGTVNVTNIVTAYCGDDALDLDQNYSGTISNAVVIQDASSGEADEAFEFDGPEGSTYTDGKFTITNATLISIGGAGSAGDLKSLAQGTISNCSWTGYGTHLKVRSSFDPADCAEKADSYTNLVAGDLVVENSEIVSTIATTADLMVVYSDDDEGEVECFNGTSTNGDGTDHATAYESTVDAAATAGGNAVNATATTGADTSVFAWTWTKLNDGF